MINVTDERIQFFDVYKTILISLENITILISIFVIKCSDYDFLLKKFFQRAVHINFINMNNKFLKIFLNSLNKKNK